MNTSRTTLPALIFSLLATFAPLAHAQDKYEWKTPKIEGYAQVTESDFPAYYEAVNNRPSIRLIAAYLPSNEEGKPDLGIHEKSGKQIIISRFPMAITSEQFPQLKKQVHASVDNLKKGMVIDLGGVSAKIADFVPPDEGENTSFATGMVFAIEGTDGSTLYQASVTTNFWIDGSVIRIEHQELIESIDDWFAVLSKRNVEVRKSFTAENTAKPKAEQAGTGQPATRPESKSEGIDKPQPEAEGRSR